MNQQVTKTDAEWKQLLTPEQYRVARKKGTERPFTGTYWNNHEKGIYQCVCCGNGLFGSESKFESGTGWPSFWTPIAQNSVKTESYMSFFMKRTEVACSVCNAHLSYVFGDGPRTNWTALLHQLRFLDFLENAMKQDPGQTGGIR